MKSADLRWTVSHLIVQCISLHCLTTMPVRCCRIGLAIAERLGRDGAHVVVSSRRQKNVDSTVEGLRAKNLSVTGVVCHVGDGDARRKLVEHVRQCLCLW